MIRHFNEIELELIQRKIRCGLPIDPDVLADAAEHVFRRANEIADNAQEEMEDLSQQVENLQSDCVSAEDRLSDAEETIAELKEKLGEVIPVADLENLIEKAKAGAACA